MGNLAQHAFIGHNSVHLYQIIMVQQDSTDCLVDIKLKEGNIFMKSKIQEDHKSQASFENDMCKPLKS